MRVYFWLCAVSLLRAHDLITTPITWDREISRIVYARCASCHHDGGPAFSLLTYAVARPWAEAIKEEVLTRRMPPWGAVKGFGEFRNDQSLSSEQIDLIASWAQGGVPEGEEKDLPPLPKFPENPPIGHPQDEVIATAGFKIKAALTLGGLWPKQVPDKASFKVTAELPDGSVEPLVWLDHYRASFAHPFFLRKPLELPKGTVIRGIPPGASIGLLQAIVIP